MIEQMSIEFAEDVKLSDVYSILQSLRTPKYILGYEERYEIYRKKGVCIQINVYYPGKVDGCENVIKKGVYLTYKGNNVYTMSFFNSECLSGLVNYDGGRNEKGGRCDITNSTKFLKWFVDQIPIYDDLREMRGSE